MNLAYLPSGFCKVFLKLLGNGTVDIFTTSCVTGNPVDWLTEN